ncbi:MAG: EAL domain-containing protein, partial [Clostridia bacterium]|nr:EAL domain-containing protein [Clostridia bacterium]
FKVYNDIFGTAGGDRLLEEFGRRCKAAASATPAVVAIGHYDADHFVSCWEREALHPEPLYQFTEQQVHESSPNYSFSVRYGFYEIRQNDFDVGVMCDRALLALRSVKHSYETHYAWYDEAMRAEMLKEQEICSAMHEALDERQFELYFQPQYNYESGALTGAEALVRWRHPERGLLDPGQFLPVFEKNGFIFQLDSFVWEESVKLMRDWQDRGLNPPSISVNVSRRDLYHRDLVEVLHALVKKYGLEPAMLRLEITESAYMENPEQLIRIVAALQAHGFEVEMDDFGSGYSSLNTLKDVPVDQLKLDMKFISESASHGRGGSILSAVVRMAHEINLPVIAEGVETRQQADYLKSIGCLYMQGYFFSRPIPAGDFEELLKSARLPLEEDSRFLGGVDEAADFLDANTQTTLLFNAFLGGAAILEYQGGNVAALRLNDRFFEVVGLTRLEFRNRQYRILDELAPDSRQAFVRMLEQALETGREAMCEVCTTCERKEHDGLWLSCRVRCLAKKAAGYLFYLGIEDISERRALMRRNEMFGHIIRNLPIGVGVYEYGDPVRPIYISETACQMFGYTHEEYIQKRGKLPIVELDVGRRLAREEIGRRLLDGAVVELPRCRAVRRDGGVLWLRVIARLVRQEGETPRLYISLADVTGQVDAEARYHDQQRELDAIISLASGGVFKYSAEDDRFAFVSDALLGMLGYTREEFLQKFDNRFANMIYKDDRAEVLETIRREVERTGSMGACEYRIETKSGALKRVYGVGRLITDAHGGRWFVAVLVDMDERRRGNRRIFGGAERRA